jgi:hypothetical protein
MSKRDKVSPLSKKLLGEESTTETLSSLPSHPFDEERILKDLRLFSDKIDDDPWTLFHGTCVNIDTTIDSKGITLIDRKARSRYLGEIAAAHYRYCIGRKLPERSDCLPGYELNAFMDDDLGRGDPVYLTASSSEALTYASPERAGGEIESSLRGALRKLFEVASGDKSDSNTIECLMWMAQNKSWLLPMLENVLYMNFEGFASIVYAIRIQPDSIDGLNYVGGTEVYSLRQIRPSELIAKMTIPKRFFIKNTKLGRCSFDSYKSKRLGVLGAIRKATHNQ